MNKYLTAQNALRNGDYKKVASIIADLDLDYVEAENCEFCVIVDYDFRTQGAWLFSVEDDGVKWLYQL